MQKGDDSAFDRIYKLYWEIVYAAAWKRVQDEQIAKDIVQEVFISLWERRESLEIQQSLQGYLLSSAKYKIVDYFRKTIRQERHTEDLRLLLTEQYTMDTLDIEDSEKQLEQALQFLPEKMRRIFEMSRKEEKTIQEISAELNLSSQTVKNQLSNALKILRSRLAYTLTILLVILR